MNTEFLCKCRSLDLLAISQPDETIKQLNKPEIYKRLMIISEMLGVIV